MEIASVRRCAALLGPRDRSLDQVLAEVLGELGFDLDPELRSLDPDVVLAVVTREEAARVLAAARLLAAAAPIVAILPMQDERLHQTALRQGARACYALDTPLERLRHTLGRLWAP